MDLFSVGEQHMPSIRGIGAGLPRKGVHGRIHDGACVPIVLFLLHFQNSETTVDETAFYGFGTLHRARRLLSRAVRRNERQTHRRYDTLHTIRSETRIPRKETLLAIESDDQGTEDRASVKHCLCSHNQGEGVTMQLIRGMLFSVPPTGFLHALICTVKLQHKPYVSDSGVLRLSIHDSDMSTAIRITARILHDIPGCLALRNRLHR